jgi:hypothetical protein
MPTATDAVGKGSGSWEVGSVEGVVFGEGVATGVDDGFGEGENEGRGKSDGSNTMDIGLVSGD